jgi:hypothetical protein
MGKPGLARFVLAQALWTLRRDRPRALALAEEARRDYESKEPAEAEKVRRWIATRR